MARQGQSSQWLGGATIPGQRSLPARPGVFFCNRSELEPNDSDPHLIAIEQSPGLDLLMIEPSAVAALEVGDKPMLAVKINSTMLAGEERVADREIAGG